MCPKCGDEITHMTRERTVSTTHETIFDLETRSQNDEIVDEDEVDCDDWKCPSCGEGLGFNEDEIMNEMNSNKQKE